MYRLATLLTLLALLAAGCGGSDDDRAAPAGQRADAQEASVPSGGDAKARDGAGRRSTRDAKGRKGGEKSGSREEGAKKPRRLSFAEALEDAPSEDVATIIRAAVLATLPMFGLELADLQIGDRGRTVNVVVTRASACNAIAKDEPAMRARIRKSAPVIRSLRFEVAGTGEELGYYVLRCKRPQMPDGPGQVVYEHTGVGGPFKSKRFAIEGKRWAIEYENVGNSLAVIVIAAGGNSKGDYYEPIGSQKRGVGRKVYKGSGSFELRIHGGGLWTVRVKDIR